MSTPLSALGGLRLSQTLLTISLLASAVPASALSIFLDPNQSNWIGPKGEPASWFDPNNWSLGVPTSGRAAKIANGGTATIEDGAAEALSLQIGRFTPGKVDQSGGSLTLATRLHLHNGHYQMSGGTLSANELQIGSLFRWFDVIPPHPYPWPIPVPWQKPVPRPIELPTVEPKESAPLSDLSQAKSFTLGSATGYAVETHRPETETEEAHRPKGIEPLDPPIIFPRPEFRSPIFTQEEGEVEVTEALHLRNGRYEISGGRLWADSITVNGLGRHFFPWLVAEPAPDHDPNDFPQTDVYRRFFPWFFPGTAPRFEQSGGEVTVADTLQVNRGGYHLKGGDLTAAELIVGGVPTIWHHFFSESPHFLQTGGSNHVGGDLEIGSPRFEAITHAEHDFPPITDQLYSLFSEADVPIKPWPRLHPFPLFNKASYRLDEGELTVDGELRVGTSYTGLAHFSQTGGTSSIAGNLEIEGFHSALNLSGGSMTTAGLDVGTSEKSYHSLVALWGSDTELRVTDHVVLGGKSSVKAEPGSKLHFSGTTFVIQSTNAEHLAGLGNLTLIFDGGDGVAAQLEVAGRDLGDVAAGFEGNFVIDTLQIGGDLPGHLTLVDLFDNQPDFDGAEALYVNHLILGPGSTLDMGGLNLYVAEMHLSTSATAVGGELLTIPEPASGLLMANLAMLWCRCRRRPGSLRFPDLRPLTATT